MKKLLKELKFTNHLTRQLIPDKLSIDNNKQHAHTPRQVHEAHYSFVHPESTPDPFIISISPTTSEWIGVDYHSLRTEKEWLDFLSGNLVLENSKPWSLAYGGHQFGSWAGQLGDGRAISLGIIEKDKECVELQLKGAGLTPFSRFADGYAVLRSSIREYLCSEAMHHLGIPTTRALALVGTSRKVERETLEPGAIVCRVASSWIRFGNFELFYSRGDVKSLKILADYTIKTHFPMISLEKELGKEDPYMEWLKQVIDRTAYMIAKWQAFGFCHGVMNTDNFSILGLTLDYGPFSFLDSYDPGYVCNTSDYTGRYSFENQPSVGFWNLCRFASAISPLFQSDFKQDLVNALKTYSESYELYYSDFMIKKCGLDNGHVEPDMKKLVFPLLELLKTTRTDYTHFFRNLMYYSKDNEWAGLPDTPSAQVVRNPAFDSWFYIYKERISSLSQEERVQQMKLWNPKYILRNNLAQRVIEEAEKGNYEVIESYLRVLEKPYQDGSVEQDLQFGGFSNSLKCSCSS